MFLTYRLGSCACAMMQGHALAREFRIWPQEGRHELAITAARFAQSPRNNWSLNLWKFGLSMQPASFNALASLRALMMFAARRGFLAGGAATTGGPLPPAGAPPPAPERGGGGAAASALLNPTAACNSLTGPTAPRPNLLQPGGKRYKNARAHVRNTGPSRPDPPNTYTRARTPQQRHTVISRWPNTRRNEPRNARTPTTKHQH